MIGTSKKQDAGDLATVRQASSWTDLVALQDLLRGRWIYRGQRDASWSLESGLERAIGRFDVRTFTNADLEGGLLRQFARRAHHYLPDVPDRLQWVEWLALMQHHGAPTRLLDFTYSFFVGVFFALEDVTPGQPCALWAVNVDWLDERLCAMIGENLFAKFSKQDRNAEEPDTFLQFLGSHQDMVFGINPYRLNQRLSIQQGLFLCPGNVSSFFVKNLAAMGTAGINLIKCVITLDRAAYQDCVTRLMRMNMTRTTLFPGLDGFAASQRMALATPEVLAADWRFPK